jgi:hypothetical protein
MENIQENSKIEIGHESLGYLDTTRKWTMFFAILGFVFLGLMLVFGLFFGSLISKFTSGVSGLSGMEGMEGMEGMQTAKAVGGVAGIFVFIIMLIFSAIYFFPLFYLFRFSRHTKNAIANLDANELTLGLKSLKSYWRYIGILVIILLAFYLLVLIFAGGTLAMLAGLKG